MALMTEKEANMKYRLESLFELPLRRGSNEYPKFLFRAAI